VCIASILDLNWMRKEKCLCSQDSYHCWTQKVRSGTDTRAGLGLAKPVPSNVVGKWIAPTHALPRAVSRGLPLLSVVCESAWRTRSRRCQELLPAELYRRLML
jgi:hypothetical protein